VPRPFPLFLMVRPVRTVLAVAAALGVLVAALGAVETAIPTAVDEGRATIPLWRLLTMGAAVVPVLGLTSPLAGLELAATRRLRSMQRGYLAILSVAAMTLYLGACALVMPLHAVLVNARASIAWFGLALIAGVVIGWRLAWTLPAATAVVLWYWGYQGNDRHFWWEFSAAPYDDVPALLLSMVLLAAGLIAYAATPWRLRGLHRLLFRR
jgi:hypothetical protein